ncbi:MAG: AsnC family transcriptional regulator [Nitrospirota bacterium]
MRLSAIDKKILNEMQGDFPIVPRPFQALGVKLGLSERDVIRKIKVLKKKGVIRSISVSFDSRRLGYTSTLVAMAVPDESLAQVVRVINSYAEVTHNYLRENRKSCYNFWFTLIAESSGRLEEIIREMKKKTGIKKLLNLPAKRFFKLNMKFDF